MMRAITLLTLCAALAACGNVRKDKLSFDGQYFRSKASKIDGDRRNFTVQVRPATLSVEGAQEAGRFEATKYCIENYGNSRVDWLVGPDDDPSSYVIEGDSLTLQGTCEG